MAEGGNNRIAYPNQERAGCQPGEGDQGGNASPKRFHAPPFLNRRFGVRLERFQLVANLRVDLPLYADVFPKRRYVLCVSVEPDMNGGPAGLRASLFILEVGAQVFDALLNAPKGMHHIFQRSHSQVSPSADLAGYLPSTRLRAKPQTLSFDERRARTQRMQPLIFLVHVPKTAGSTVHHALRDHLPNGRAHVETFIKKDEFAEAANSCDWMTGHVDFATAKARLTEVTGRPVRFFAFMRSPASHVASHYNWQIEIFHRGAAVYDQHPEHIRRLSERIRASDNTDPAQIIANIMTMPNLFLNFQTRYVLGAGFNWSSGSVYKRLAKYEMIADQNDVGTCLCRMLGFNPEMPRRVNEAKRHVDYSLFETEPMRRFFLENNWLDEILYRVAFDR